MQQNEAEPAPVRESLRRRRTSGQEPWPRRTLRRYGLEFSVRPTHRPRQAPARRTPDARRRGIASPFFIPKADEKKADEKPDLKKLKPFYEELIAEYFPASVK